MKIKPITSISLSKLNNNFATGIMFLGLFIFQISCKEQDPPPSVETDKIVKTTLLIPEPSDLVFSTNKQNLYTVSDNTGMIYNISFEGKALSELPFKGSDLEGITIDPNTGEFYVCEERTRYIIHLNSEGKALDTIKNIQIPEADPNGGLEGISKNGDTLYIINEKSPGLLIKYHIPSKTWKSINLTFAFDYSAIMYDISDNTLWILSHESKKLFHCTNSGKPFSFQEFDILQAEGVAVDRNTNTIWIVSDNDNQLYKISLSQTNY